MENAESAGESQVKVQNDDVDMAESKDMDKGEEGNTVSKTVDVIQDVAVKPDAVETTESSEQDNDKVEEEAAEAKEKEETGATAMEGNEEDALKTESIEESKENGVVEDKEVDEEDQVLEHEPIELIANVEDDSSAKADEDSSADKSSGEERASGADDDDVMEIAEQDPSSISSSPSALHIHLDQTADDEDKDEADSGKDREKDRADVDPSLPLISNVVSLSSGAAVEQPATSSSSTTSPIPSGADQNGNRRTTLRLKRGIEISFDVDQNGQPVTVNNQPPSATESTSTGEPHLKRGRLEELEDYEDHADVSELDAEATNNVLAGVQKDIRTLRFMAKQKEKEWNSILKLMKVKEELQAKLMRRREVLKITTATGRTAKNLPSAAQLLAAQQQSQVHQSQSGQLNLQSFITQSLSAIMANKTAAGPSSRTNNLEPRSTPAVAVGGTSSHHQHMMQQQQMIQQQPAKMMSRQRPILPKPNTQQHHHHSDTPAWSQQHQNSNHHSFHHSGGHHVVDSVLGADADARSRNQGTINVQSLIADYRAKHPEEIPTRGRRVRGPSRVNNDPNSSSSPPPQLPGTEVAGMSFKDVLLQFAKMSSRQNLSNNPVDLSSMSKESASTSSLAVGGSSSAAALQNLAAARNARSTTSPGAGLSAGSILQSALSGGRANQSFAPTLAQLLTNPANEQQQQPAVANNPPTVSMPVSAASSSSATTAAEVLTLSNLLATAKGHVTITSERENTSDDVTIVGGSASGRNASTNSNYMRTSGGGEVPKCQGCNERVAQFVCAGCSSQWYCSRECQVAAWEDHSENCVG